MSGGGSITHVIKSGKHHRPEKFNGDKLHKSLVSACLSAGVPTGYSENIAQHVVDSVSIWLEGRPEVTSSDIRRVAARHLNTYHPDASYLYEHHRSTL